MPIQQVYSNGKYAYQYGNTGKKYFFNPNNINSATKAYSKALKQTQAINASKNKRTKKN